MTIQLRNLTLAFGGILALASMPAFASSFSFVIDTGASTTDTYTSTTGTFDIRELTNGANTYVFNASGTGDSDGKDLVVSYCLSGCSGGGQSLTISTGSATGLSGVANSTAIYSASTSLSNMITGTSSTGSPVGLNLSVSTGVFTFNSSFISDIASSLGIGSTFDSYSVSGGISGGSGSVTSDSLAALSTPEPSTLLLSGGGLLFAALWMMRRRTAKA